MSRSKTNKSLLECPTATRVGVIEIGSRAVRLLVADVNSYGVESFATRVEDTGLVEAIAEGRDATLLELEKISRTVARFREIAISLNSRYVTAFGTESLRQVVIADLFPASFVTSTVGNILDVQTEALCSLVSGLMGLSAAGLGGNTVLVIDQGAGSLELAFGRSGSPPEMLEVIGLPLGGSYLLRMFGECQLDINLLQGSLRPVLDKYGVPNGPVDHVVVQGTAATKCAWLVQRKVKSERYNPNRVHGTKVQRTQLEAIFSILEKFPKDKQPAKRWAEFQEFVNPGEQGGDAGERVASGIVPLLYYLRKLGKEEFIVSSLGTRHGMAWLLAKQPAMLASYQFLKDLSPNLDHLNVSGTNISERVTELESLPPVGVVANRINTTVISKRSKLKKSVDRTTLAPDFK